MYLKLLAFLLPSFLFSSVYLTFTDDPATTLDVVTIDEVFSPEVTGTKMHTERARFEGHLIEHCQFKHLSPNTEYTVTIGKKQLRYKTLPKNLDQADLKIAVCGDVYRKRALYIDGMKALAKEAPQMVVLGGDIAYTRGHVNPTRGLRFETARWIQFFTLWEQYMRTEDGLTIPLVPCVGNHDVRPKNGFGSRGKAFYAFFPQLRHSYYTLSLANHVRLLCLDTGHSEPMEGRQTTFVQKVLASASEPYKIACYHIPAYPSYASYTNKAAKKVRALWCPLFDTYHVDAAFEHDNHMFKRTKPIAHEHESNQGTFFFGDGCLGTPPRNTNPNRWYLEKTASVNHYFLLTANKTDTKVSAFDLKGNPLDSVTLSKQ